MVKCELVSEPRKWCIDVTSNLEVVRLEWRISGFDFSVESEGNGSMQLRSTQTMRTYHFATRSSGVYEHTVPTVKSPSWVPSCIAARRTLSGEASLRALRWRVASWCWDRLGLCSGAAGSFIGCGQCLHIGSICLPHEDACTTWRPVVHHYIAPSCNCQQNLSWLVCPVWVLV